MDTPPSIRHLVATAKSDYSLTLTGLLLVAGACMIPILSLDLVSWISGDPNFILFDHDGQLFGGYLADFLFTLAIAVITAPMFSAPCGYRIQFQKSPPSKMRIVVEGFSLFFLVLFLVGGKVDLTGSFLVLYLSVSLSFFLCSLVVIVMGMGAAPSEQSRWKSECEPSTSAGDSELIPEDVGGLGTVVVSLLIYGSIYFVATTLFFLLCLAIDRDTPPKSPSVSDRIRDNTDPFRPSLESLRDSQDARREYQAHQLNQNSDRNAHSFSRGAREWKLDGSAEVDEELLDIIRSAKDSGRQTHAAEQTPEDLTQEKK